MDRRTLLAGISSGVVLSGLPGLRNGVVRADPAPGAIWRVRKGQRRRVVGRSEYLIRCPSNLQDCTIIVGSAPKWEGQPEAKSTMTIAGYRGAVQTYYEKSPLKVPLLRASLTKDLVDDFSRILVTVTHEVTLQQRGLERGQDANPPSLSEEEKTAYCRPTETLDYEDEGFSRWCTAVGLDRRTGEDNLTFAYRAYKSVCARFKGAVKPDQTRKASSLYRDNGFECNSSSTLFGAILRRNRIPTRILCCRNVRNSTEPGGTMHMKNEFFQDGIGWIPVDVGNDSLGNGNDRNFGTDWMNLITVHFGPDLVIEYGGGRQTHQTGHGLRQFLAWQPNTKQSGFSMEETWTVRDV